MRDLERFRKGELPAGDALAGKRVGVAIDGGRVRLRKKTKRKAKLKHGKKKARQKFQVRWREPKLLIIYEIGEDGKMAKKSRPFIDGTFHGPDEAMELLAMHLHVLGAAKATEVVFLADGAPWAWERAEETLKKAGISKARYVLDFYHAAGQLGKALAGAGLPEEQRKVLYKELRSLLLKGKAGMVVERLRALAEERGKVKEMEQPTEYLKKHALAGRMRYDLMRRLSLPMGSGAIESAVRRVINLRLKGNAIMWKEKNAEGMLAMRAAALTDRWDDLLAAVHKEMATDGVIDPGPLSRETPCNSTPLDSAETESTQRSP